MKTLFTSRKVFALAGGMAVVIFTGLASSCNKTTANGTSAATTGATAPLPAWGYIKIYTPLDGPDQVLLFAPKLNPLDREKFNALLAKPKNKSLYKIVPFKNGKPGKARGTLKDTKVGDLTFDEVIKAAEETEASDDAWLCDSGSGGNYADAKAFVEKVEKILAQYVPPKKK